MQHGYGHATWRWIWTSSMSLSMLHAACSCPSFMSFLRPTNCRKRCYFSTVIPSEVFFYFAGNLFDLKKHLTCASCSDISKFWTNVFCFSSIFSHFWTNSVRWTTYDRFALIYEQFSSSSVRFPSIQRHSLPRRFESFHSLELTRLASLRYWEILQRKNSSFRFDIANLSIIEASFRYRSRYYISAIF